jgi:hypothetical protein
VEPAAVVMTAVEETLEPNILLRLCEHSTIQNRTERSVEWVEPHTNRSWGLREASNVQFRVSEGIGLEFFIYF